MIVKTGMCNCTSATGKHILGVNSNGKWCMMLKGQQSKLLNQRSTSMTLRHFDQNQKGKRRAAHLQQLATESVKNRKEVAEIHRKLTAKFPDTNVSSQQL